MRRLAGVLAVCAALLACGVDAPPEQGYVRKAEFTPAHWEDGYRSESRYGYHCGLGYDGKYNCGLKQYTEQVYEEHHEFINDAWRIFLEDCHVDQGKNKCRTGWRSVDETTFHKYPVGSHYPDPR